MTFVEAKGDGVRILSLDGGNTRCLSQLVILNEIMHRLGHDLNRVVRPCEYFHTITGVGVAGVIAVFLGVFGMTCEQATDAFGRLCSEVFTGSECSDEARSERLIKAVKGLLQELSIVEDARLEGDLDLAMGCHVSICYSLAVNMGACLLFRTYTTRYSSQNPTIFEAIRASWATPGIFSSVLVRASSIPEKIVSAVNGFNNPTRQALKEAHDLFGNKYVSSVLSLGAGNLGARSVLSTNLTQRSAQDTEHVANELHACFDGLGFYYRFSVEQGLDATLDTKSDALGLIADHTKAYLAESRIMSKVDAYLEVSSNTTAVKVDSLVRSRGQIAKVSRSRALPQLSAFFVMRKQAMLEISSALNPIESRGQNVAVVTGISGSGKTQISLKYAYDNDENYDDILFIDASSEESIKAGLISQVQAIDQQLNPTTANEALDLIARAEGQLTRSWLIIMDNADSRNVNLSKFFPPCKHGSILITSRNTALTSLTSNNPIRMDVMSQDEAVEALLCAARGTSDLHTKHDIKVASAIARELGYLPVALIHAGCYIKVLDCLDTYLDRLKVNRASLLRQPPSPQRDMYKLGAYAAFDTTSSIISESSLRLLGIFSFFHFTNFPRAVICIAAACGFDYQPYDLCDRTMEYQRSIQLLRSVFCPGGIWDEDELDKMINELLQYSLIELVRVRSVLTFRFHPLFHAWSNDRLSPQDRALFGSAAVRLVVCGTNYDHIYLWEYLSPHVSHLIPNLDTLHVNDRACLTRIFRADRKDELVLETWKKICQDTRTKEGYLRYSRAALGLAEAFRLHGQWLEMQKIQWEALNVRLKHLGENNPETANAMEPLAGTLRAAGHLAQAEEYQLMVLRVRRSALGPDHRHIVHALVELASTYNKWPRLEEAEELLVEALTMSASLVGSEHEETLGVISKLAGCYSLQGKLTVSVGMMEGIVKSRQQMHGAEHAKTLAAEEDVARVHARYGAPDFAEETWRNLLLKCQGALGDRHSVTLNARYGLGKAVYVQGRFSEAEALWQDVIRIARESLRNCHHSVLEIYYWLARAIFDQGRYIDARTMWSVALSGEWEADDHCSKLIELFRRLTEADARGESSQAKMLRIEAEEETRRCVEIAKKRHI